MIRLNLNENPFGFPDMILKEVVGNVKGEDLARYVDSPLEELRECLVRYVKDTSRVSFIDGDWITTTAGSDEGIVILMSMRPKRLIFFPPTYFWYYTFADGFGLKYEEFPLINDLKIPDVELREGDMVFLPNPNNPTGHLFGFDEIEKLLESPATVVIDEAYFEFSWVSAIPLLKDHPNMIILRTFSKAFAFAGQRFGYVIAHPEWISEIERHRQPYNVGILTQRLVIKSLENRWLFFGRIKEIEMERERTREALEDMGLSVFPSHTNFLYFKIENASDVVEKLKDRGILVRELWGGIRVSIGKKEDNSAFTEALSDILAGRRNVAGKVEDR